jgi:hypothetical protein
MQSRGVKFCVLQNIDGEIGTFGQMIRYLAVPIACSLSNFELNLEPHHGDREKARVIIT